MKDVTIAKFDPETTITYPVAEQVGTGSKDPVELTDEDYNFNAPMQYPGFKIHHVETLQPEIYYIRGLVDHVTTKGTLIDRYVFSARINMRNFTKDDFKTMIEDVMAHIKMADNLNNPAKEA